LGNPDETLISAALNGGYFKSSGHEKNEDVKILYQSDVPPVMMEK